MLVVKRDDAGARVGFRRSPLAGERCTYWDTLMEEHHPHARHLRRGRHSQINQIYLITTCTQDRQPLFTDWYLGRIVVAHLREADQLLLIESLCFVVMPDHLHWLFALRDGELATVINRVKSKSAIMINRYRGGGGTVWQKSFHDHALRADEDVVGCARYVVANPLRAGLVKRVGDYPLWDAKWL